MMRWSPDEWKIAVAQMWSVKQRLSAVDHAFEHRLPRVAATAMEIDDSERRIGETLHPEQGGFLSVAGGWPAFWHDVDVLGPAELGRGELWNDGLERLSLLEHEGVVLAGVYMPVAVSRHDKDLFVISKRNGENWGELLWLAGEEVDRFPTFREFLLSMTEYLRSELAELE